jgi:hypothetical protein
MTIGFIMQLFAVSHQEPIISYEGSISCEISSASPLSSGVSGTDSPSSHHMKPGVESPLPHQKDSQTSSDQGDSKLTSQVCYAMDLFRFPFYALCIVSDKCIAIGHLYRIVPEKTVFG